MQTDIEYMQLALDLAAQAAALDEVPVGAVVVYEGQVVGRGYNRRETDQDPSSHAEFTAMIQAARTLGTWRLCGCTVYVTLEPCIMCAGLMHQARVDRCVYAAPDPKAGALGSLYRVHADERLNHNFEVTAGVLEEESARMLKNFFAAKREAARAAKSRPLFRLSCEAPAKVNLFLGVQSRVVGGRHLLDSVFHTLELSDTLSLEVYRCVSGKPELKLTVEYAPGIEPLDIAPEDNLVLRAVRLLAEYADRPLERRYDFHLVKRVPAQAGLGGGSSDCAAALALMSTLWGLDVHSEPVQRVAAELGSDIAFFLYGGCVHMSGYGEVLEERLPALICPVLLVKPAKGVSTGAAYRSFDADPPACGPLPQLLDTLRAAEPVGAVAPLLANNLEPAACSLLPELADLTAGLSSEPGVLRAMLSGSGSCVFSFCESDHVASALADKYASRGFWTAATGLLSASPETIIEG